MSASLCRPSTALGCRTLGLRPHVRGSCSGTVVSSWILRLRSVAQGCGPACLAVAAGRPFQCTLCWDRCALACCALGPVSPPQPPRRGQSSPSSCLRGAACPLLKMNLPSQQPRFPFPLLGSRSGTPPWGKYSGGQHGLGTALTPAHQPTCFSESVSPGRQGRGHPRRRAGGFGGNPITEGPSLCPVQTPARGSPRGPRSQTGGCSRTFIHGLAPNLGCRNRGSGWWGDQAASPRWGRPRTVTMSHLVSPESTRRCAWSWARRPWHPRKAPCLCICWHMGFPTSVWHVHTGARGGEHMNMDVWATLSVSSRAHFWA